MSSLALSEVDQIPLAEIDVSDPLLHQRNVAID